MHVLCSIADYPVCSALGVVILSLCLLKLYYKLTLGICDSDQNMAGKTVLITGTTSGIGKATAFEMAKREARVILACRDVERAKKMADEIKLSTGNHNVVVKCLDLSSFRSVRKCAQDVLNTEDNLHVLINNAGLLDNEGRKLTEDGNELVMQTNYLGHFLLTLLLLDLLLRSSPSRIINVASVVHKMARLDLQDLTQQKRTRTILFYPNSNLARILITKELAERLRGTGVTVNALHPGYINTNIADGSKRFIAYIYKHIVSILGKTADEGCQTIIQLAVDQQLQNTTGRYFIDCKEAKTSKKAEDADMGRRLFELSKDVVGASFSKVCQSKSFRQSS